MDWMDACGLEVFIGTFAGLGLIMFGYVGFDFIRMKYTIWKHKRKDKKNG